VGETLYSSRDAQVGVGGGVGDNSNAQQVIARAGSSSIDSKQGEGGL